MTAFGRTVRTLVVGAVLAGATAGLTACGSSDKVNPGGPGTQAPSTSTPTSPASSKAPSGGGAAF